MQNIAPSDSANYNDGFAKRKILLSTNATNNLLIPLNNYSFFESFQSEIASCGKVSINISLESDDHVIFRPAGAAEDRYVISRFVLWVPKMIFNYKGENLLLEKYFCFVGTKDDIQL